MVFVITTMVFFCEGGDFCPCSSFYCSGTMLEHGEKMSRDLCTTAFVLVDAEVEKLALQVIRKKAAGF
jgi:hypothetical protein